MPRLTREQQINAFIYDLKVNPTEEDTIDIDGAIISILQDGLATYDPLVGEISISAKGKRYLENIAA